MFFVNNEYLDTEVKSKDLQERVRCEFLKSDRFFRIPLMYIIVAWVLLKKGVLKLIGRRPKINFLWFDGFETLNRIKEGARSWKALDSIYNYSFRDNGGRHTKIEDWWFRIANAQAVRNRLRIVSRLLESEIIRIATEQEKTEVKVFSIASGSAQAVLEAASGAKKKFGITTKITLLDLDQSALDYSKNLAKQYGLNGDIVTIQGSTSDFESKVEKPDIVELVGFLDYRPQEKAVRLADRIRAFLPDHGSFITANIIHNPEKWFMTVALDWPMIYRTKEEFKEVFQKGGFKSFQTMIEPHNIHAVGLAYKA
jgi:hypothetical protein